MAWHGHNCRTIITQKEITKYQFVQLEQSGGEGIAKRGEKIKQLITYFTASTSARRTNKPRFVRPVFIRPFFPLTFLSSIYSS